MPNISLPRINDCGLADYPPGGSLGPRTLPDFEFLWMERGECRWEFDGRTETCPPGSVLLCPPGMRDTWTWDPEKMTRHGYVHFEFAEPVDIAWPLRRDCSGYDVLRPLLRHTVWLASLGGAKNDALAAESLRQAITWFVTGFVAQGEQPITSDIHPVILRVLRVLRRYWGDGPKRPPSISTLARETGVSRGHLARVCRRELGVTPQEFLRYLRLDHGLLLLGRTNMKINEISDACGFQNQFHFSRCFRQAYGASPRDTRKQLREGDDKPLSKLIGLRRLVQIVG